MPAFTTLCEVKARKVVLLPLVARTREHPSGDRQPLGRRHGADERGDISKKQMQGAGTHSLFHEVGLDLILKDKTKK